MLISQAKVTLHGTGETFPIASDEYIPQVYSLVDALFDSLDIHCIDSHTLKLTFKGVLVENYPNILDHLYEKEEWKKDLLCMNLGLPNSTSMSPVMSLVRDAEYVLYENDIRLQRTTGAQLDVRVNPSVCFVLLPESYPRHRTHDMTSIDRYVGYFGRHHVLYADIRSLRESFVLELTINNYAYNYADSQVLWEIPVIFPFASTHIKQISFNSSPYLKLDYGSSNITALRPHVSTHLWGMESVTPFPFPEPIRSMRLGYGGDGVITSMKDVVDEGFKINEAASVGLRLKYAVLNELDVAVKVGKNPIPLALYEHLENIRALSMPLATTFLTNTSSAPTTVMVNAQIEGISGVETNTVDIAPGQQLAINHKPHISPNVQLPQETRETVIKVDISKVASTGLIPVRSQTYKVRLLAKDTMIWYAVLPTGENQNIAQFIACWVTPHDPEIDAVVARAVHRCSLGSFSGYQQGTVQSVREQVKAIYDELSSIPLRYVSRSISFGGNDHQASQRVLAPSNTLRSSGNCIDLTVLMASALENIGLYPAIVLIPGHAFLAWEIAPETETYDYLECTLVGTASFDQSNDEGKSKYATTFDPSVNSVTQIVNIRKMRAKNVYPMV